MSLRWMSLCWICRHAECRYAGCRGALRPFIWHVEILTFLQKSNELSMIAAISQVSCTRATFGSTMSEPGNACWSGRISTVDLLVVTSSDPVLFIMKIFLALFTKRPILMRRLTVLGNPLHKGFPGHKLRTIGKDFLLRIYEMYHWRFSVQTFNITIIYSYNKWKALLKMPSLGGLEWEWQKELLH